MRELTSLEAEFLRWWHIIVPDAPEPEHNVRGLIKGRRFEVDFLWRKGDAGTVVECQGGIWRPGGGAHNRATGFEDDCEKLCGLVAQGYRVFYITSGMLQRDPTKWIGLIYSMVKDDDTGG